MDEIEQFLRQITYMESQRESALARGDFDMASCWESRYDDMLNGSRPFSEPTI